MIPFDRHLLGRNGPKWAGLGRNGPEWAKPYPAFLLSLTSRIAVTNRPTAVGVTPPLVSAGS